MARPLEFEEIRAEPSVDSRVAIINEGGKKWRSLFTERNERRPLDGDGVPMSRKTRFYSRLNKLKHKPLVSRPAPYPPGFFPCATLPRLAIRAHYSSFLPWIPRIFLLHPANKAGDQGCGHSRRVIRTNLHPFFSPMLYRGRIYLSILRGHLVA